MKKKAIILILMAGVFLGGCSREDEIKMVDVFLTSDTSVRVVYNNGDTADIKYRNELECAEEYSNLWYEIFGE